MGTSEKATDNNIDEIANKIVTTVQETEEAFIFHTLSNFTLNTANVTVEKEELLRAIYLIRMMKETGMDIHDCYASLSRKKELREQAYERGLQDGAKKEHDKVFGILEKYARENGASK